MQITNEDYKLLKPLLFSISYRMLGSVTEAEDMVQDTFLKAFLVEEEKIDNIRAYLCKMVTNRCLDLLKSANTKRLQYIGPWNPEPLLLERPEVYDPAEIFLQKEGLSIAYLRMMEHLTPDERAILLLRDAFHFSYQEITKFIEKQEANCRKIYSRAKQKVAHIENESLHYEQNKSLVERFIEAFQMQKMDTLLEVISDKVTLFSDGGGKVRAATRPIVSIQRVLALLFGIANKATEEFHFEIKNVNGQPGILVYLDSELHAILSVYIQNQTIVEMYLTMNPDKLP